MVLPLTETTYEQIHDAFIDAFSEYEVEMDISMEKLMEMLTTRSYSKEYSLGFFDGSLLAGFILIGFRAMGNERVFYDTGTGIRQNYQKQGIGNALVERAISSMDKHKISSFVLEVLENNTAAQDLYKKNGFYITRKFNCYEMSEVSAVNRILRSKIIDSLEKEINIENFCSFKPSWQNTYESYLNVSQYYNLVHFDKENKFVGYAIIHKENGSILQIGIAQEFRTEEILKDILFQLRSRTSSPVLKHLNIEENSEMDRLFGKTGITKKVSQFEMIYNRQPK